MVVIYCSFLWLFFKALYFCAFTIKPQARFLYPGRAPTHLILSNNPLWPLSWFTHWNLQFAVISQSTGWIESSSKPECSGKMKEQGKCYWLKCKKQVPNLHEEQARCSSRNPQQTISLHPNRLQLWLAWTAPRPLPRFLQVYSNRKVCFSPAHCLSSTFAFSS